MMTKSSNFASAVKISFYEFQEWIKCKFPHYAMNQYCMYTTGNIRKAKWYFQGWNDNSNGSCATLGTLEK